MFFKFIYWYQSIAKHPKCLICRSTHIPHGEKHFVDPHWNQWEYVLGICSVFRNILSALVSAHQHTMGLLLGWGCINSSANWSISACHSSAPTWSSLPTTRTLCRHNCLWCCTTKRYVRNKLAGKLGKSSPEDKEWTVTAKRSWDQTLNPSQQQHRDKIQWWVPTDVWTVWNGPTVTEWGSIPRAGRNWGKKKETPQLDFAVINGYPRSQVKKIVLKEGLF